MYCSSTYILLYCSKEGSRHASLYHKNYVISVWFWWNYCMDVHRMESYSCLTYIRTRTLITHTVQTVYIAIGLNNLQIICWGNGLHTPLELKGMNRKIDAVNQFCLYGLEVPGFNSATDCWTNRDRANVYDCIHPACMRPAKVDS